MNISYYTSIKCISETYKNTFALSNYHSNFELGETTYISNKIVKISSIESSISLCNDSIVYEIIPTQSMRELILKDNNLSIEIAYLKFMDHKFDKKITIHQGQIGNITIINHKLILEINSLIYYCKNHTNNMYCK